MRRPDTTNRHAAGLAGFLLCASLLLLALHPPALLADPSVIEAVVGQRYTDDLAAMQNRRRQRCHADARPGDAPIPYKARKSSTTRSRWASTSARSISFSRPSHNGIWYMPTAVINSCTEA